MSYHNPPIPWRELERRISGRPALHGHQESHADQVGYRRVRKTFGRRPVRPEGPVVPYAELHCHSSYSFLDGASSPEDLVTRAVELGLSGLALTDHDGLYGQPRPS